MDHIISFLKGDDNLPALAAMALVNHNMYDLAIPKLYKCVTINEENKEHVQYGHSSWPSKREDGMSLCP